MSDLAAPNSTLLLCNANISDLAGEANSTAPPFSYQCLMLFNYYYVALIVVVGIVGNTLSFLVFTQTHLKLRSSSYYLAALAVSDLGYLVIVFMIWLQNLGKYFN